MLFFFNNGYYKQNYFSGYNANQWASPVGMLAIANCVWKPLVLLVKVKFGSKVIIWCTVLSLEDVIVYDQASERHLT